MELSVSHCFTPKYRRKAIYAKLRTDIGKYLRRLCEYKGVEIVEAHAMADHANLKYNYGSRHFWSEGYYVSTVGLNKKVIINYIKNQELEDQLEDKRSLKEYKDPFTGK